MKYLGKITDNKDLVTKEYVDTLVKTKQDKLIAGANITIAEDGKTISSAGATYMAGDGIAISPNNVISIIAPKVYSGADAPADTLGNNGDIYIQTSEA